MLNWNKALWMDVPSYVTIFNQSECIISAYHNHCMLKFVYDIVPCHVHFKRYTLLHVVLLLLLRHEQEQWNGDRRERETKTVWTRKRKKDMEANRIELQRHRNRFRQTAAAEASFVLSEKIIQVFYFSSLKPPSVLGKDKGCNLHASPCQNSSVFILKICRNIQITLLK